MNKYLSISPEVQQALDEGRPVVALESTIISHGMPYPQNVETALKVEQTIRDNGAVPATIAIIGGKLKAGCTPDEIEYLGKSQEVDYYKESTGEAFYKYKIVKVGTIKQTYCKGYNYYRELKQ